MERRRRPRLGPWWAGTTLLLLGLVVFGVLDHSLVGGLLIASGFGVWAGLRYALRGRRSGGLVVRSLWLDLVTLTALAINVAGTVVLTLRHIDWRPLAVLDVLLLGVAVWVIRRERARRRTG